MSWKNEKQRHSMSAKGVKSSTRQNKYSDNDPIFNKKNYEKYIAEDSYWTDDIKWLVLKYKARAAMYGPVAVYENYIPLWRPIDDDDPFESAQPNTLYVWNIGDLDENIFKMWVGKVKKRFPAHKIEAIEDPGGA